MKIDNIGAIESAPGTINQGVANNEKRELKIITFKILWLINLRIIKQIPKVKE